MLVKQIAARIYLKYIRGTYSNSTVRHFSTQWEPVIGLEIHAQISTISKLFSGASTTFSSPVNTNVSLFDCSIPGTLPVLNKRCVEAGVITALALNCNISPISTFDRKHYFYADIPAGYQITQQRSPLARDGLLQFHVFTPGIHKLPYQVSVRIKQLQLEQDSGKSLHDSDRSLVDLNRAGIPLMELVFEPDLVDGEEAAALVKELCIILQKIGTCSCKMEEGALRVDANVSIHRKGQPFGIRTEIKNIGSIRGVANAISFEIQRQIQIKNTGGTIINETRAWDAINKITVAMRDKEEHQDYRYMPEPNLPPLHIAMGIIEQGCISVEKLKESIPELPGQIRERLQKKFGLSMKHALILVSDISLLTLFEAAINKRKIQGTLLANLLINDFLSFLHKINLQPSNVRQINGDYFGEMVELLENGEINRITIKLLLNELINGNKDKPSKIVKDNNWMQITDDTKLREICEAVLNENQKIVQQYKNGKTKVFKSFLGLVAAKSKQKANMGKCNLILKDLLERR